MHRDYDLRLEQLNRLGGVSRSHGEIITDRQQRYVDFVHLANQLHIHKQTSVAGVVDRFAAHFQDDSGRIAAVVGVVFQGGTVMRDRQFHAPEGEIKTAADVERVSFQPLTFGKVSQLEIGDDGGIIGFGNGRRIAPVVAVTVRDQYPLGLDIFRLGIRQRIAGKKRIDNDIIAIAGNLPARLAVELQFDHYSDTSMLLCRNSRFVVSYLIIDTKERWRVGGKWGIEMNCLMSR